MAKLDEGVRLLADGVLRLQGRLDAVEKAGHKLEEGFHGAVTEAVETASEALHEARDERRSARAAEERTRRAIERAVLGSVPAAQPPVDQVAGEGGGGESMPALQGEGELPAPPSARPRRLRRPI